MRCSATLFLERGPTTLRQYLSEITAMADREKEALGFLPHSAFEDAINQKRLMAMVAEDEVGQRTIAGYILFGGVYPHARVQQVCVRPEWRERRIASALIDALVSDLERTGFLSIKANVASDLPYAQRFYEKHGFQPVKSKPGGSARNRTIIVRVRDLDTDHLFSASSTGETDLELPSRFGNEAPFYTFDLNVFFDLVKNRKRYDAACALFGAALKHRIRLGIAPEFITELRRTTKDQNNDPVLHMALQLPRLPLSADQNVLEALAENVHRLVFVEKNAVGAGSSQARSDAKHLAYSALCRVSAFITSDKAILDARDDLLAKTGIDVASLDELVALLPDEPQQRDQVSQSGRGFECKMPDAQEARDHYKKANVPDGLAGEFVDSSIIQGGIWRLAIWERASIVAIACLAFSPTIEGENRLLIHVEPGHLERELYADHLLDAAIRQAYAIAPGVVRLLHLPGQSMIMSLAKNRGFVPAESGRDLVKVAAGHPLTSANWNKARHQIRRRTGIALPKCFPGAVAATQKLTVTNRSGKNFELSRERLEDLFGPTIILWQGREGVVVPIQRAYADELLGTNIQTRLSFIESRDAAFLSRRAYVNTPRARSLMCPGRPILFYESRRSGGRSAIVAAGRIVDSVIVHKDLAPNDRMRRVVVDNIADFSASDDVLLTTFDNLLIFPSPVSLVDLRRFSVVGKANLRSATFLSHDQVMKIFEAGWASSRA